MIPIRTNVHIRKTPYANYALIAINAIIFILSYGPHPVREGMHIYEEPLRQWAQIFMLTPDRADSVGNFRLFQLLSYAFLHGGLWHIVGNMYFLYIFGNNVNDKLGNRAYILFYLFGAIFSGLGHMALSNSPVLGASGAVAAVTGAFVVLFPRTIITVLYWFFFIGTFELPAMYFIGFKLILYDNMIAASSQYVAYNAHLAGYAYGIGGTMLLLAMGLLEHTHYDMWYMLRQWNRRRIYRESTSGGYDPFSGYASRKKVAVKDVSESADQQKNDKLSELRGKIASLINQRNLPEAANLYVELVELDETQVLSRQYQLDIGNQLMSMGRWVESASAYEKFLSCYESYEYAEQVRLMLGILYSRYLDKPTEAIENLKLAREKLGDAGQIKMCDEELGKLENSD